MANKFLKAAYYALISLITAVALLLIISIFPIAGNYSVKVVLSGSMEPAIKTGSTVAIKPASSYEVGDIITFGEDTQRSVPTTHRIVEKNTVAGEARYLTKGDANNAPDAREVGEDEVIGKVFLTVPYLGYLIDFAKQPAGFVLLIAVPAVIIAIDEVRKIFLEARRLRRRKRLAAKAKGWRKHHDAA